MRLRVLWTSLLLLLPCSIAAADDAVGLWNADHLIAPQEARFFKHLRQLTFEGENAEAYWSPDSKALIFQRTPHGDPAVTCDQIYTIRLDTKAPEPQLVSTGQGRTTCAWLIPNSGGKLLYASTHAADPACPPPPDRSKGYVWPLYHGYDIFQADGDGSNLGPLVQGPDYDAEATVDMAGHRMVYTALRDGDLNLFVRDLSTGEEIQVTDREGYDGGAVWSPAGTRIAWRAHYPEGEALADYRALLVEHLIRPGKLELWVARWDGSGAKQVTNNGAANFGPWFMPDGRQLLFSSNVSDASGRGREFDLHLVELGSGATTRVTFTQGFDGFPMFSPDGKYLAFCSNRGGSHEGNTNVFIAEWNHAWNRGGWYGFREVPHDHRMP
ncbi:MAG TPA: hypothetical protein VEI97_04895 [bacterium]|nr:hypothetical protein [bacterium]